VRGPLTTARPTALIVDAPSPVILPQRLRHGGRLRRDDHGMPDLVGRDHGDAQRGARVGGADVVGLAGRPWDCDAGSAAGVAALPLTSEGNRRVAPSTRGGGQGLALRDCEDRRGAMLIGDRPAWTWSAVAATRASGRSR
jgi:hypothetical protein